MNTDNLFIAATAFLLVGTLLCSLVFLPPVKAVLFTFGAVVLTIGIVLLAAWTKA